jgi:hypothetical protein
MLFKRGITSAKLENTVDIRNLESRLRDAGCSRSQAKMYVARAKKALVEQSEEKLRDATNPGNSTQRDAEADPGDMVNEIMERIQKLI